MALEEGEFLPPSATGQDKQGYPWELSPDGSIRVQRYYEERRNNEFWENSVAYPARGGEPFFVPPHSFETRIFWTGPRSFAAFSGEAFGQGAIRIDVDVDADRATVARTGKTFRLKDADRAIRRAYNDYVKTLPPPPPMPPAPPPAPVPREPVDWKSLLLGLGLALILLAAIALGSYVWHETHPPERPYPPPPAIKPVDI